jgi:hypothetical protein
MQELAPKVNYNDKWLIIVAVPLINLLNYYLTYPSISFTTIFFLTFTIDTITGYLSWYALRSTILWLDKKIAWEDGIVKRLLYQIPLATISFLVVIVAITELVNFIATDKRVPVSFYTFDLFIFFIWGLFLNVLYLCFYLFQRTELTNRKTEVDPSVIWIKIGRQQKPVNLDGILCFFVEHDSVYAVGPSDKQIVAGFTLDKLEKIIDPSRFFRANRQFLITRSIIKVIRREENGKLSVMLDHTYLPESIMVSRLRAAALREWVG